MKTGMDIKTTWSNCGSSLIECGIPNFLDDSQMMCDELFVVLKDFCLLPKLRKENLYVESNLNTIHQTYMFDLLYDQQDIYDHYDEIFEDRNNSFDRSVRVRQPNQPFSLALENFDEVLSQFSCEKDFLNLANLRWYSINAFNESSFEKDLVTNKNSNSEINSVNSTAAFSDIFNNCKKSNDFHSPNQLLSVLNSLTLTLNFFCSMSYDYISLYTNEDKIFFDCFLKMYKAYVSAAIHMNNNFENLNVIVNYAYETNYKHAYIAPKFSIYRLMLITWHKLVTIPLSDINKEKNLLSASLKYLKTFIVNEFEKMNDHLDNFSYFKSKSDPPENFGEKKPVELDFMSDDENFYYNKINLNNKFVNFTIGSEYIESGNDFKYDLNVDANLNPTQQAEYFLEGIPSVFLDIICNEYSTFYINDSEFPVSHFYQIYEKHFIKNIEKFVKLKLTKTDALTVLDYFRNSEFFTTKIINRTRNIVIDSITSIIINYCEVEITHLFISYINTYSFESEEAFRDLEMFYRVYDLSQERSNMFYSNFMKISLEKFREQSIAEYAVMSFLRELTKGKNKLYYALHQTLTYIQEEKENREYIDKHLKKENKRRNISIHNNENYEVQIYNFNTNLSFAHIFELYSGSNCMIGMTYKNNEGKMVKPIEDMPTLPQSLDIEMKMEDNTMDVEYDNDYNNYLLSIDNQFR